MFFYLILLSVLIQLSGPVVPSKAGRGLTYSFGIATSDTAATLKVTLEFQGNAAGSEEIDLPKEWSNDNAHPMKNLRVFSGGTIPSGAPDTGSLLLDHAPNARIILTYDLLRDWKGPLQSPFQFHPVILKDYIEIYGANSLIHPRLASDDSVTVHFDWSGLPCHYTLATSFGADTGQEGRRQSFAGTWRAVEKALFAAGDFRLHRFDIQGYPVIVAIRGNWVFKDHVMTEGIQRAVNTVREFWQDYDFPYFLVTCAPFEVDHGQTDGSAYTHAFWMFMSRKDSISGSLFATLAHEHFHNWNTGRMGYTIGGQAATDWFHEGFTDYYGNTLAFQAGQLAQTAYLKVINRDLRDFNTSKSPYVHGLVIALWLDATIRDRTTGKSSLKNVMFDMIRHPDQPITNARLFATIDPYLSPDGRILLRRAVEKDSLPLLSTNALGPQVALSLDSVSLFDLGFDFKTSWATGKIVGVRREGPAFIAGLRNGQLLLNISLYHNDVDREAKFIVRSGADIQTIGYFPRGRKILVQQAHILSHSSHNPERQ